MSGKLRVDKFAQSYKFLDELKQQELQVLTSDVKKSEGKKGSSRRKKLKFSEEELDKIKQQIG